MVAPYQRLAAQLRHRIASGEWPPGTRLPSGRELRAEYDVGRGVVEYAMAQLRREGLIEGRRGARPEVVRPAPSEFVVDPREDWPFTRTEPVRGALRASPDMAGRLHVPERSRLTWTRWECLGPDGWPAMLETTYRRGTKRREYARVVIDALVGEFTAAEAHVLGLHAGATALRMERTRFAEDGRPVETADLVLRADRWRIRL